MTYDIIETINNQYNNFSKSHKLIADYILLNIEKAAYMTAAKLGETVFVSESTVVRFASEIGFDGYPELMKHLREVVRSKLTAVQRMEIATNNFKEHDILTLVINSDINKMKQTLSEIDRESFNKAVEEILSARKIYILGVRSSAALASFLGFYFNLVFDNVKLIHTNSVSEMFEQIINLNEQDVVIGISFPRYSKRTIKALKYAKSCNSKIIAITDSVNSPLTETADYSLLARSDMASFVDSLVAPLSLINALIVAISMSKQEDMFNTFNRLEKIWDEYQVYDNPKD